ncbi:MAG TPA: hypothetical protein VL595_03595 [Pseudonocardia sp.]|jgi:hypothetical protein|nr:hypothetical protein [Pseudonocardia sp.]
MAATAATARSERANAVDGALAGTLAGLATGALAARLDMLPTLGMVIGSHSAIVGGFVHLILAAALGALFGVYLGPATHLRDLITAGLLYGIVWWLIVPLVLIPAWITENTSLVVVQFAVLSMAGQAIYGPICGALVYVLRARRTHSTR